MNVLSWSLAVIAIIAAAAFWLIGQNQLQTAVSRAESRNATAKSSYQAESKRLKDKIDVQQTAFLRLHEQIEERKTAIAELDQRIQAADATIRRIANSQSTQAPDSDQRKELIMAIAELQGEIARLRNEIVEIKRGNIPPRQEDLP